MKVVVSMLIGALLIIGCGDSNESSNDISRAEADSLMIPVDGNTVRNFSFLNENILFTRGCVTANLYDSSDSLLYRADDGIALASEGNYTYIANKYFNNSYTAYSIVYATSMNITPENLISGNTYSYPAGTNDLKKLVISEATTLSATASSSAHIKVYDSNLNFVNDLYVTSQSITLNVGTYYLLLTNGSCIASTEITVNIL